MAFLVIVAAGALFTWWTARRADSDLRLNHLLKARFVAQSVTLDRVKRLTGTVVDIDTDNYRLLKARLDRMRSADPNCRSAYLLGRFPSGEIFFYVDSEPVGSEDEAPAGQIFKEAPAEDYHVFESRQEVVVGPVTDRWGTWVSAAVPLIEPETGELVAVLGLDVDARDWWWSVAMQCALPVGIAALMLTSLGVVLLAYRRTVERKLASLALEERESRLAAVVQASPIATFVIDRRHRVTHWNRALEALSRIPAKEVLGTRQQWRAFYGKERPCMADLMVDEAIEMIPRLYEGISQKSKLIRDAFEATDFFPAMQGGAWLRFTAAPIRNTENRIVGAIETLENITDRVTAEIALRESEHRFRSVLENLERVAVHAHDAGGTITFWNNTCQRFYGFSKADALGRDAVELLEPPAAREAARTLMADCLRSGATPPAAEIQVARRDGTEQTLYVSRVLHQRPEGSPEFFCFAVDITERKQAEEELRQSQALLHSIFRSTPVGIGLVKNRVIQWTNEQISEMTGYTEEELAGQSTRILYPTQEDYDYVGREKYRLIAGAGTGSVETRWLCKDGRAIDVLLSSTPLDVQNLEMGVVFTAMDITMRKANEHALRLMDRAMASSMSAVVIAGLDGRITYVNRAFTEMWGYTRQEAMNMPAAQLGGTPDGFMTYVEAIRSQGYAGGEAAAKRKDGTPFVVQISASLVTNEVGKAEAMLATFLDITEHKRAEQALKAAYTRLEALWDIASIAEADFQTICDRVLSTLVGMTNSGYGFFGFLNADESVMTIHAWSGMAMSDCEMDAQPRYFPVSGGGVWAEAVRQQKPLILNDYAAEHPAKKGFPDGHVALTNLMVVPYFARERIVTLVALANRPGDYVQDDVTQVTALLTGIQAVTDRMEAERALRESEERHRVLFETSQDALMTLAPPEWRFTSGNLRTVALYGAKDEAALINLAPWDVAPALQPDGRPSIEKAGEMLETALRNGSHFFEWMCRRLDGTLFPATVLLTKTELAGKMFLQCTVRDITSQKQAEESLRMMAEMLDVAPSSITVHDFTGRFLYANRETFALHGYTPEEFMALNLHDVDVPTSESLIVERMRVIQEKDEARFEVAHFRKDGTTFPMEVFVRLVEWRGQPALLSVATDISARKQAEDALREKTEELERYFTTALDLFCIADTDGHFRRLNQQWEKTLGYSPDDLVGKRFLDLVHPDDIEATEQAVAKLESQEEVSDFINRYRCSDGSYRWIEWRSYPSGKTIFAAARDVTDRIRTEAEKERLEAELQQAQKMEAVGRLAGGVAHDFNNMLSVIMGHADLALTTLEGADPLRQDLEEIRKAAERSADLTRQLLAFARKQTIAPRVLDLNDAIENMLKMLRRLIGEDIELVWLPAAELWRVKMDPVQINQILANLAVNARDAIAGTGRLSIETANAVFDQEYCRAHAEFSSGCYVMLAVSDNGCGMSQETMGRLFEPFFTTKGIGKGTGLGLATIYGIVRQNNGFINVYSEIGHGTTFRIYVPQHLAPDVVPEKTHVPALLPTGNETILLVEDEPPLLKLLKTMMERLGYTVMATNRPSHAIQLAAEYGNAIHLLVTDLIMPEMNGRQLAERIQAVRPCLKCLFVSGYTANVIAHHGIVDEGIHFLAKPCTREMLAMKIREVLD